MIVCADLMRLSVSRCEAKPHVAHACHRSDSIVLGYVPPHALTARQSIVFLETVSVVIL